MSIGARVALSAVIGGTAEKLGGGKPARRSLCGGGFANGAVTGAYVMMFNHINSRVINELPTYDDLYDNYPKDAFGGDMLAKEVYELIGGQVLSEHDRDPSSYGNACALRVSRALNYSDAEIPYIKRPNINRK